MRSRIEAGHKRVRVLDFRNVYDGLHDRQADPETCFTTPGVRKKDVIVRSWDSSDHIAIRAVEVISWVLILHRFMPSTVSIIRRFVMCCFRSLVFEGTSA